MCLSVCIYKHRTICDILIYIYIYIYIYGTMGELSLFLIINFAHALCVRFYLLCSKLESVGHSLWRKQQHDTFHIQKFGNGILYGLIFPAEVPVRRFQSVRLSVWGQIHIPIDENLTPSPHDVWSGDFTHLFILPHLSIKCLEEVVLLWIERMATVRQQYSDPCHASISTQSS